MSLPLKLLPSRRMPLAAVLASLCLVACGGGGNGETSAAETAEPSADAASPAPVVQATSASPQMQTAQGVNLPAGTSRADAFRLLTQATFGPTDAEVTRTMTLGAGGWVDEQLAKPAKAVHLTRWNSDDAAAKAKDRPSTSPVP